MRYGTDGKGRRADRDDLQLVARTRRDASRDGQSSEHRDSSQVAQLPLFLLRPGDSGAILGGENPASQFAFRLQSRQPSHALETYFNSAGTGLWSIQVEESTVGHEWLDWRLNTAAVVGALIAFLSIVIYGFDLGLIVYVFIAAPIIGLILFVVAMRRRGGPGWALWSMLAVYLFVSWGLFENAPWLRWNARWLFYSREYKAIVAAQPAPADGSLRHVVWDGWGWAGIASTSIYLILDPNDSLAAETKKRSQGKFDGIPCAVYRIDRVEKNYYAALFYTETSWDHCN